MPPLLTLLATQPQLLADHLQAYSVLVNEELCLARAHWRRQLLLQATAFCSLTVAAVLAGAALMLWAATASLPDRALWVFWITPLAPLVLAAGCLLLARQPASSESFANLARQLNADMAMLRAASTP